MKKPDLSDEALRKSDEALRKFHETLDIVCEKIKPPQDVRFAIIPIDKDDDDYFNDFIGKKSYNSEKTRIK